MRTSIGAGEKVINMVQYQTCYRRDICNGRKERLMAFWSSLVYEVNQNVHETLWHNEKLLN